MAPMVGPLRVHGGHYRATKSSCGGQWLLEVHSGHRRDLTAATTGAARSYWQHTVVAKRSWQPVRLPEVPGSGWWLSNVLGKHRRATRSSRRPLWGWQTFMTAAGHSWWPPQGHRKFMVIIFWKVLYFSFWEMLCFEKSFVICFEMCVNGRATSENPFR